MPSGFLVIPHPSASQTPFARRRRQTPLFSSRTSPLTGESPLGRLTRRESFLRIRILRCVQNDIGLSLRAFEEGVAIRVLCFTQNCRGGYYPPGFGLDRVFSPSGFLVIPHPSFLQQVAKNPPSPLGRLTRRESFLRIRILRCAQNDIGLSLRAFEEGVAIRVLCLS